MDEEKGDNKRSVVGRLLTEISWEGRKVRQYRKGGQGFENVLTAEVLQALNFLPRKAFMGCVLDSLPGKVPHAAKMLADEIEAATFDVLPGGVFLNPLLSNQSKLEIQPDALLVSPSVYCLVEAKRIGRSSFQPEQLAREYVAVIQNSRSCSPPRLPLLLLLLPEAPPVRVEGLGLIDIHEAVSRHLGAVLERTREEVSAQQLLTQLSDVVAYTTWSRISECIAQSKGQLGSESVDASVDRLADAALRAIQWHGEPKKQSAKKKVSTVIVAAK